MHPEDSFQRSLILSQVRRKELDMIDISVLNNQFHVRRMNDADADAILHLCRGNPLYYQYCGAQATREQVLNDLNIAPPGVKMTDKYYIGFYRNEELVAVMDLIDGYPEPDMGYIGFFMMNAGFQGKQIGSGIIQSTCAYLKEAGKRAVRLGIAEDNPQANHFWKKNGFVIVGRVPMDGWTALVAEKTLLEGSE